MAPEKNEESSNRTNLLHAENFQNAEHEREPQQIPAVIVQNLESQDS